MQQIFQKCNKKSPYPADFPDMDVTALYYIQCYNAEDVPEGFKIPEEYRRKRKSMSSTSLENDKLKPQL